MNKFIDDSLERSRKRIRENEGEWWPMVGLGHGASRLANTERPAVAGKPSPLGVKAQMSGCPAVRWRHLRGEGAPGCCPSQRYRRYQDVISVIVLQLSQQKRPQRAVFRLRVAFMDTSEGG